MDTVSRIQNLIEDDFVSTGTTDTYSYSAVMTTINFFLGAEKDYKFKAVDVTETRGVAIFSWVENNSPQQYEFIYVKDWKENR